MIRDSGFTLVEMMVTLTIAAILLAVASPSFRDFFINNNLSTQANELVTALSIARSEAVKRGVRVTVCSSVDPAAVNPACSAAASWADGFIVFVDNTQTAGNTRGVVDGADEVLRVFGPLSGSALTAVDAGPNSARAVSYLPSGWSRFILDGGADGENSGSFALCHSERGRNIIINTTGRVRTEVVNAC